jgi:mannosylglycoprotein endo-beta-mannosidase
MEAMATDFYVELLGHGQSWEHDINLNATGLSAVDLSGLEASFSAEEVWTAIRGMPANKSPGPNGFSWDFYQTCWSIVKDDVRAALQSIFLGKGQNFGRLNGALLTLLPKKDGAVDLKDFRPISLVHSFSKLLAKIIALRLGPRMPELVDANQSAFVRGRCIHDNFVLVQQSARALFRAKVPSLLLKLDVAKAFDSVSWPFLVSVLRQRGFGPRLIGWIILLLSTARTRVVVNGSPGEPFAHGRGLRQGDPISPLLFIIVMNVVSAMFRAAEDSGLLSNLQMFGIRHRVSLYADDVVVFAKPSMEELQVVYGIIACFGKASGLVVNLQKSTAIPIRCTPQIVEEIAPVLACPIGKFPCRYLGLPLSLTKLRRCDVQPLVDKLAKQLPFWKARLLTREGRVVYVQAVMTASVIYPFLALDLEPWVFKLVDKLRRGFLWVGREDARGGSCLVAWQSVCQPKTLGGLGFHNLRWLNAALRVRWIWYQRTSDRKPWLGLDLPVSNDARALFNAAVRVDLGDGTRVLFWQDPWIHGLGMAAVAPAVLALVQPGPIRTRTAAQGCRNNAWVRDITGVLTVDAVVQFLHLWPLIQTCTLNANAPNAFVWKLTASGEFSTKSTYQACFAGRTALPAASLVWASFAPLKHKFFGWLALRGRCWTADRLRRRGLPNQRRCPLCAIRDENLSHLLLQCHYSRTVWLRVLRSVGLQRLLPSAASELGVWWPASTAKVATSQRRQANSLILLVLRGIWLERNSRVFDNHACDAATLSSRLGADWHEWLRCRSGMLEGIG